MQRPHSDSSIARPATSSQTGWAVSPKRWPVCCRIELTPFFEL
jgi:hypothetical protein